MKSDEQSDGRWPDTLPTHAPVVHRNLDVWVGARKLTTLTSDHLAYWLSKLPYASTPFMTVSRANEAAFIQTYRNSDVDYSLEVHSGTDEGEYLDTTVSDLSVVGQLIWDWLEDDWQRLDAVDWTQRSFR